MNKEEFERRVAVVLKVAEGLAKPTPDSDDGLQVNEIAMTKGEALAFYERLVEDLDAQLEQMMEGWQELLPTYTGKKDSGQG